jgi:hypothetical protein
MASPPYSPNPIAGRGYPTGDSSARAFGSQFSDWNNTAGVSEHTTGLDFDRAMQTSLQI